MSAELKGRSGGQAGKGSNEFIEEGRARIHCPDPHI